VLCNSDSRFILDCDGVSFFLFFFGSRERRSSIQRQGILGRVRRNSIVVPCCFQEEDVKMTEGGEGFLTSSFFFFCFVVPVGYWGSFYKSGKGFMRSQYVQGNGKL
jgi:hypothetical protein